MMVETVDKSFWSCEKSSCNESKVLVLKPRKIQLQTLSKIHQILSQSIDDKLWEILIASSCFRLLKTQNKFIFQRFSNFHKQKLTFYKTNHCGVIIWYLNNTSINSRDYSMDQQQVGILMKTLWKKRLNMCPFISFQLFFSF